MRFARFLSRTAVAALMALALVGVERTAAQDAPAADKDKTETPAAAPAPSSATSRGPRPGDGQRVFVLRYVDAGPLAKILSVFPATISFARVRDLETLAVSANPAVLAAIEETIKRLDTPPAVKRNVEVTVQVLECSTRPDETSTAPGELQDVVGQLKRTFKYAGCSLAQTLLARGREGSNVQSHSGVLRYSLVSRVEIATSDTVPVVKLSPLRVEHSDIPMKVPAGNLGPARANNLFDGHIDVRSGQRVVAGKLGSSESGKDEILVVTAKILD
jgi:hypothetical protein